MALNKSRSTKIEHRRSIVAELRLRGLTMAEIAVQLAEQYKIVNSSTKRPFSTVTVFSDLKVIHERWMEDAKRDIDEHKARQLAELAVIKRMAAKESDYDGWRRAIETEMRLLGTKEPEKREFSGKIDVEHFVVPAIELPDNKRGDWSMLENGQEQDKISASTG